MNTSPYGHVYNRFPCCFFSVYVPESCCVDGKSKILCQGDNEKYDGPPVFGPPNTEYRTHKDNPALHTDVSKTRDICIKATASWETLS